MNGVKVIGLLSLSIPLGVIITRYYYLSSKHNKLKKKAEEIKSSSSSIWSELDSNLLGEIVGRLCLTDQARFRSVCKNWLAAPSNSNSNSIAINSSSSLPWWVSFNRETYLFEIYDPSSSFPNRVASVQNISLTKLGIPYPSSSSLFKIRASVMQDWFCIFVAKRRFYSRTRRYYFLFFSPLTKKTITLPQFHQSTPFRLTFSSFIHPESDSDSFFFNSTFSTRPDSPDCVFFLLDTTNVFAVLTYRNGDKQWTARQFKPVPDFLPTMCRPVYLAGILYIVSPFGQLASFNYCNGEFKYDNLILDDLFLQNAFSDRIYKMFTLNGELMIMFYGPIAKANVNLPGKPCIRRYDWSSNRWIPVSTLGDNALFVSERMAGISITCTKDRTNNGILSSKIYQVFDGGCLIYSIQDGDLVEFKSITSNLLEDGGASVLPEYKYTRDIKFKTKISSTFWFEPPSVRPLLLK